MLSLPPISDLLSLLRAQGVAAFRATADSIHVEFAPGLPSPPAAGAAATAERELDGEVNAADLVVDKPALDLRHEPEAA